VARAAATFQQQQQQQQLQATAAAGRGVDWGKCLGVLARVGSCQRKAGCVG
jgi:hypothetical protein